MLRITHKALSHTFFIVSHVILQGVTVLILQTRKLREVREIMGLDQRHIACQKKSENPVEMYLTAQ